jgi:hypothetical protein
LFCPIPENVADAESLWRSARPLDAATLPAWLAAKDAGLYRWMPVTVSPTRSDQVDRQATEIAELEAAAFIVDRDPADQMVRAVYIARRDDDVWSIGIYRGTSPLDLSPVADANPVLTRDDVSDVAAIAVADPFLVPADRRWFMFFEVMTWPSSRGEIAYAESENGVHWKYGGTVLRAPFHLSYPHVFEWNGAYYMVPESSQAGVVNLYRATRFPTEWSIVATLLEGRRLMDPTIFRYGDRWWLFVETNERHRHATLRLYQAGNLMGPWQEHPRSPVIDGNPRAARPAGRVLVDRSRVVRFAQDCHPRYGSGVRAFEVTELTPSTYTEHEVSPHPILSAGPLDWQAGGMHHVDVHRTIDGGWLAAVDGRAATAALTVEAP